ncbi:MAG TPA: EamA family transporter [Cyclobacteriaceae bacterium]|nr:EamA family transporter [Cyclobacteriaceae bacterium]
MSHKTRFVFAGLLFAMLWSSASVAGKFGIQSAEPLTLFTIRFILAGTILLGYVAIAGKWQMPTRQEWLQITIFGAFNTALYLGIFIIALEEVAAGITALMIALNPLLISMLSSLWMRRPVASREWLSILLGMAGVAIATWPLLENGYATVFGVVLLITSMFTYSIGSVYYASVKWSLSRSVINGWQVLIGGLLLLPFTLIFEGGGTTYDTGFWLSIGWLIFPVSIGAVQLWLYLLKEDAVKASLWLFLCPIFGLLFSSWLLDEPFTLFTAAGALIVLGSLYLGQEKKS